ncbi:uncharacterized protein A4U43_C05F6820 [Asparagus officinalis]|uniref:AB hydrolase-1 domain-containing protein n=1 Tax=Asparagus officinalis TaxID=4686 RepID=A0A5P1EQH3_ASPOF|nr:uncharacterized protein A4U43_C05F6820 [Asparagus officinalis]
MLVAFKLWDFKKQIVTTKDGYILSLLRLPNGRSGAFSRPNKIPVLLQHGLLMAYWDWSWDELAANDLRASFDYVYQRTGNQTIHYVGHSLGTLIALATFSQHKLLSMVRSALCPIAYLNQITSLISKAAAQIFVAEDLYWLGLHKFDPNSKAVDKLLKTVCMDPEIDCYNMISAMTGPNCCLNSSSVEVFLDHEPQATSTKNMIHLAQMIRRGTITKYDYDDNDENMSHYGQISPPVYNMSKIPNDLPLFLSYGGQDKLSDDNDVSRLLNSLHFHDGDKMTVQYQDNYAHADFVMAVNAKRIVYDPLMAFFELH